MKPSSDWLRLIEALQSQNEVYRSPLMSPIRERLLGERGRSGKHVNIQHMIGDVEMIRGCCPASLPVSPQFPPHS